jgi:hypothetical protein
MLFSWSTGNQTEPFEIPCRKLQRSEITAAPGGLILACTALLRCAARAHLSVYDGRQDPQVERYPGCIDG